MLKNTFIIYSLLYIYFIYLRLNFRPKKKGVKQETVKLLNAKGMLPAKSFNYNAVDFSSFQGGSNIGKQEYTETVFKQNKVKKTNKFFHTIYYSELPRNLET